MTARLRNLRAARVLIPLLMLVLATGLAACNRPGSGGCDPEDLSPIVNLVPADDEVVAGLSPMLTWDYGGSCEPDSFEVTLISEAETETASVDALSEGWTPTTPLEPASTYEWSVRAISGSNEGTNAWADFRTGPACEVGDPDSYPAPILISPADGATVDTTTTITVDTGEHLITPRIDLDWEGLAGCVVPGNYEVQISRSPTFSPTRNMLTGWTAWTRTWYFFAPGVSWSVCDRFYWRVTPLMEDGTRGQTSDTWSFVINTSGMFCPLDLAPDTLVERSPRVDLPLSGHGTIAGHVWHDECAVPYETTDVVPPGCVILPDGTIEANGVLDPGETGIEGVTVMLDDCPCPGVDGWSVETDANGYYSFRDLSAGTYCIEVDDDTMGNEDILIPGNWTAPYRWYGPSPIAVDLTLGSDDDISRLNDFGWDYQFLPSPAGAPSATPLARVLTDARCRLGPGFEYPILTYLSQGVSFPITGRLERGGWWQLRAPDLQVPCWIGEDVVEPQGDLTKIPFAIPPELPTKEPTKAAPTGCWCGTAQQCCQFIDPCPAQCQYLCLPGSPKCAP